MLSAIGLLDWKSFGSAKTGGPASSVLSTAQTTLLVGPNASGKSNVLDALQFLHGMARGLLISEVFAGRWEGRRQTWPGIRGGEAEAARVGHNTPLVTAAIDPYHYFLSVDPTSSLLAIEAIEDRRGYLLDTQARTLGNQAGLQPGGGIRLAVRSKGGGRNQSSVLPANRSLLSQLGATNRTDPAVMAAVESVSAALRGIVHLDIQPDTMRKSAPLHASVMGAAGENVAAILRAMEESAREELIEWLSELCAPKVSGFDFVVIDQLKEVVFQLVEGTTKISSRSLSDGTLRFLGILVGLLTVPEGTIVTMEEPDVGLHPARVHLLAELLEQIPKRRNIQVIATTHSPGLLAHASDELLANTIAFDRDPETGCTVTKRVGDLPGFERLRDSKERAHLVATGWLERAV